MSVSFQTNTLKSRRKANIDGHEYIVRRYGNIERFEVLRLRDEMNEIIAKYPPNALESDMKKKDLDRIYEIANKTSDMCVALFDDGTEDQELSRKLVASLEDEDILDLVDSIFKQTEPKDEEKS